MACALLVGDRPRSAERVELVCAALPEADRAPFAQDLDGALDKARLTRKLGPLGHVVEAVGAFASVALSGDRGAAAPRC